MLVYSQRGPFIRVSRPPSASSPKGQLIAAIDLRKFNIRMQEGIDAVPDEVKEIESAAQELKSADPEKRAAIFGYSAAARDAMKYYLEKATDLDKQLIGGTVRDAFMALRKTLPPPKPRPAAVETKPAAPISPEVFAEALYRALAANSTGKLKGAPNSAKRTEIRGFWDLNEVAKKLLSQA